MLLKNYFDGMIVLLIDDKLDFDEQNDENMDLLMMIHSVNKQDQLPEDLQQLKFEDDRHLPRKKYEKDFL